MLKTTNTKLTGIVVRQLSNQAKFNNFILAPALILKVGLPAPLIKGLVHYCSFCVENLAYFLNNFPLQSASILTILKHHSSFLNYY